jgi:hypothetical protein
MKIQGACHCGNITYEATVDPDRVTICHCSDCQALTGSAYRVSVPTLIEEFALQTGSPTIYLKTGESGAERAQVFCSNCGSPLYSYAIDDPKTYGLRTGCIVQRHALIPKRQIWCRSALSWTMCIDNLPKRDRE